MKILSRHYRVLLHYNIQPEKYFYAILLVNYFYNLKSEYMLVSCETNCADADMPVYHHRYRGMSASATSSTYLKLLSKIKDK
jgi:hypothetical protein